MYIYLYIERYTYMYIYIHTCIYTYKPTLSPLSERANLLICAIPVEPGKKNLKKSKKKSADALTTTE